jgi:hypothetical protein
MQKGVTERAGEGCDEDFGAGADAQVFGDFAQADGGVGADARLFVVGGFGKVFEELAIDGAVGEFGDDCKD